MLLLGGKSREFLSHATRDHAQQDDSALLPRISKHNQTGQRRVCQPRVCLTHIVLHVWTSRTWSRNTRQKNCVVALCRVYVRSGIHTLTCECIHDFDECIHDFTLFCACMSKLLHCTQQRMHMIDSAYQQMHMHAHTHERICGVYTPFVTSHKTKYSYM